MNRGSSVIAKKITYEYENAIHVPLPALNESFIKLVGVGETYGPDLRRGFLDWPGRG